MGAAVNLDRLARVSGGFAMVAIDQREALRGMLAAATASGDEVDDRQLVDFKVCASRQLSPHASAMLMDAEMAAVPSLAADALAPGTGLIIAVDRLIGPRGGAATSTQLDVAVNMQEWSERGADAFKFLVFWGPEDDGAERDAMTRRFIESCRQVALPSVLEVIVPSQGPHSDEDELDSLVVEAARWAAAMRPDLYKAQVPSRGAATASDSQIIARSEEISQALDCPWVVLSNGVKAEDFERAVVLACKGGASGFLAGRAIWSDTASASDHAAAMRAVSVPRLKTLGKAVDEHCRPWQDASSRRDRRS